jgi:hypothetical protein
MLTGNTYILKFEIISLRLSYTYFFTFQICGQFLRQGKRRKLTTQDVERAMKWFNAEPVYGHGAGSNEPGYTRIVENSKSGNLPIFVPDEKLIDLRPYSLTQSPAILASMSTIQGKIFFEKFSVKKRKSSILW